MLWLLVLRGTGREIGWVPKSQWVATRINLLIKLEFFTCKTEHFGSQCMKKEQPNRVFALVVLILSHPAFVLISLSLLLLFLHTRPF